MIELVEYIMALPRVSFRFLRGDGVNALADLLYLALTVLFLALCWALVKGFERL
jgi:hypothetical protein